MVWGGMLTFIASGKHCREYGEGVGCGGCYRSLPAANTVDGTVKVSYGVGWGGVGWHALVHCQWQTLSTVR